MTPFAIFGIDNGGLNLAVNLLLLFLVVLWFSLIYWTYADARRRIADPVLIGCATAASLFPFVGTLVYLIVRPPEYLEDVRERELEMQAAEARLHAAGYYLCPHCDSPIERDYLMCPTCLRKLKEPCLTCKRPIDPTWKVCAYCEAEVGVPPRKPARRRRTTSEQAAAAPVDGEAPAPKRRRQTTAERAAARQSPPTS
ncbi:MAG: zinc ribbon domain-containing protein [Solirubrobacteraceae bacterium]